MDFAVIGGDMRQEKLAELFAADGNSVAVYGLGSMDAPGVRELSNPAEAMKAQYIVLPLPAAENGILNAPMCDEKIRICDLFAMMGKGKIVFLGKADHEILENARKAEIEVFDYFDREELAVKNAAATAEGAVQILMEELPVTLSGMRCLILGFGRIGKLLALKLHALGAEVTVSARKFSDFAWIEAYGYKWVHHRDLSAVLKDFDAVVNTVPARVLDEKKIELLNAGTLCLDLASKPGGIDFEAAAEMGVKAIWALSLPGRVAPVTSGAVIRDTIYNMISELEGKVC